MPAQPQRISARWLFLPAACLCAFWHTAATIAQDQPSSASNTSANWPQWRGPLGSGLAPYANPPLNWNTTRNVRWKVRLPGEGHATPIVWQNHVYIVAAQPTKQRVGRINDIPPDAKTEPPPVVYEFLVLCFDRRTGGEVWRRVACRTAPHEGRHPTNSYASASPVTDGKRLYVSFGSRGVYCYTMDGTLLWNRNLGQMHTRYGWGEGASPAIMDDTLVANWDHEGQSFIIALDAATGATRWKVDRDEPTTWATPFLVRHGGRTQVIVNGTNRVRSYDLRTGEVIWACSGQTVNAIPTPLARDGVAYCMSGYRGAMAVAISLDARGDLERLNGKAFDGATIRWRYTRATPYVPSPILIDDQLYFTRGNSAILTALDIKTGKPTIREQRIPGIQNLYASPAAARGRIYFVGRDGTCVVVQHGRSVKVLATNRIEEPVDASPVLIDSQLLLRGAQHLYCFQESSEADTSTDRDEVTRALQFMTHEVAEWRRRNHCYSCHNNGDAARVLFIAKRLGYAVDTAALRETLDWLAAPGQWEHNGGDGEFNDKKLATLQFSAALLEAYRAGLVDDEQALRQAAHQVSQLRSEGGVWRMNAAGSIGAPVNYCDALATGMAVEILEHVNHDDLRKAVAPARRWLRSKPPRNVVTAASLLLALAGQGDAAAVEQRRRCLTLILDAQQASGGWGPFVDASAEPYDTALVLVALARLPMTSRLREHIERGRRFLEKTQLNDGSWTETTRPPNGVSYAQRLSTTAWCTQALLATVNIKNNANNAKR